jgi:hypothetical protein
MISSAARLRGVEVVRANQVWSTDISVPQQAAQEMRDEVETKASRARLAGAGRKPPQAALKFRLARTGTESALATGYRCERLANIQNWPSGSTAQYIRSPHG